MLYLNGSRERKKVRIISDTVGSVLIEIQPDFTQFERELTKGLQAAAQRAQKAAQVSLGVDAKGAKAADGSLTGLNSTLVTLNESLNKLNTTFTKFSEGQKKFNKESQRNKKVVEEQAGSFAKLAKVLQTVAPIATYAVLTRNLTDEFQVLASAKAKVIDFFKSFSKASADTVGPLGLLIQKVNRFFETIFKRTEKAPLVDVKAFFQADGAFKELLTTTTTFVNGQKIVKEVVTDASGAIVKGSNAVSGAFKKSGNAAVLAAQDINKSLGNARNTTVQASNTINTVAGKIFGPGTTSLNEFSSKASETLGKRLVILAQQASQNVKFHLSKAFSDPIAAIRNFGAAIVGVFSHLGETIRGFSTSLATLSGAGNFFEGLQEKFRALQNTAEGPLQAALGAVGTKLLSLGPVGAAGVAVAGFELVSAAAGKAILSLAEKASRLNESNNAINVTLGEGAAKFKELIPAASALGLTQTQLNEAITPIVPLLKNAGVEGDALAEKLNQLTRRSVDLGSVFNKNADQVIPALAAALRGEVEPAERLGISFNAAAVEARALADGAVEVNGQLTEESKILARYNLILERSADVAGDYANTSTDLANATRNYKSTLAELGVAFSAVFLPAANKIRAALNELATKSGPAFEGIFKTITPVVTQVGEVIADVAVELGVAFVTALKAASSFIPVIATVAKSAELLLNVFEVLNVVTGHVLPGNLNVLTILFTKFLVMKQVTFAVTGLAIAFKALGAVISVVSARAGAAAALIGTRLASIIPVIGPIVTGFVLMKSRVDGLNQSAKAAAEAIAAMVDPDQFTGIAEGIRNFDKEIEKAKKKLSGGFGFTLNIGGTDLHIKPFKDAQKEVSALTALEKERGEQTARNTLRQSVLTAVSNKTGESLQEVFTRAREAGVDFLSLPFEKELKTIGDLSEAFFAIKPKGLTEQNEALQKLIDKQEKLKTLATAVVTAEKAVTAAKKSAEDATKAVTEALQGEIEAKERVTEITEKLAELETKRQVVLNDTIRDIFELAAAEDALASVNERIRDIGQERVDVLKQIAELSAPATAEDIASADRAITKATIDLNRAKRDEQKLLEELNKTQEDNIDLTGLSLDQLKTSLADIRARTAAQRAKAGGKPPEKTEVELAEDKTLARIGTIEAEETLKKLQEDREALDTRAIDNADQIRELAERLVTIDRDEAALMREHRDTQTELNTLKSGETGRAIELRGIDQTITDLAKEKKTAEDGVAAAAIATKDARAAERISVDAIKTAQDAVLQSKKDQNFESGLLLGTEKDINNALLTRIGLNSTLDKQSAQIAANELIALFPQLRTEAFSPEDVRRGAPSRIEQLADPAAIADLILHNPNKLRDLLRSLGVTGLAEGGVIQGVPSAFGKLIRVGEFGRAEAVLPLTRPAQLQDVLMNSQVLSPVLNALGRISLSDAVRPSVMGAAPRLAPSLVTPRNIGSATTERRKPTRMEQKLDRLIQLMEESNSRELKIEAPITVTTSDPDRAARQTVKQLKRRLDNQSRLRG